MTVVQKFLMGLVMIGGATAVLLPGRQTPQVIRAGRDFVQGTLYTAMSGKLK